jgi:hypothetical protein
MLSSLRLLPHVNVSGTSVAVSARCVTECQVMTQHDRLYVKTEAQYVATVLLV